MKRDIVLFTGIQRFCRTLKERGYRVAILRERGEQLTDREEVDYIIDYDSRHLDELMETARRLDFRDGIVTVINRRERRVREFAALNMALGRKGVDLQQAEWLTDKYLMRKRIAQYDPSIAPRFELIEDPNSSPRGLQIGFPVIIKPRNLFKSQLVVRCDGLRDLAGTLRAVTSRMDDTASRHGITLKTGLLAEEVLRGRELSIDSFVSPTGKVYHSPVVDLVAARDMGIDDYHVFARMVPTRLDPAQVGAIERVAEKGIKALQLINSPAHMDVILTASGPKLLEVGARVGGYRSDMIQLSFGIDLDEVTFSTALGKRPDLVPRFDRSTAVLEFFPPREGILKWIRGLEEVRRLESFHRLRERTKAGERVGLARQGYRCPLFVVLNHHQGSVVQRDMRKARETITIVVE
jgi:hypothetical protein